MKFSTKDFFSKCDKIRRKLFVWCLIFKTSSRCLQPLNERISCRHPFGALELVITELHSLGLITPFFLRNHQIHMVNILRNLFTLQNASGFLLENATVLLQNTVVITRCIDFITKCGSYYKMQFLS